MSRVLDVLFLCTGNSARSIMAEAYLNAAGKGRFAAYSAGSRPTAPRLDFVFTVCDRAAGEVCPIWPGQPMTVHWGVDDPAAEEGSDSDKRRAFFRAYIELTTRVSLFLSLPIDKLDRLALQKRLDEIGKQAAVEPG